MLKTMNVTGCYYPSPDWKPNPDFKPTWTQSDTDGLNKLFEGLKKYNPVVHTTEDEDKVSFKVVAVESAKENFEVIVKDGLLTIIHKVEKETALSKNFTTKFLLTGVLRLGSATASYKEGVLTVEIPKVEPKQISVK